MWFRIRCWLFGAWIGQWIANQLHIAFTRY